MSAYIDYLAHSRHQEFLREAETARLRRVVRADRATRVRVRSGLLAR
jgi:hypothetical protein